MGDQGHEGEGFISRRHEKKTKCQEFSEFMYNKRDGTVMGRTCKSWLLISIFYIIFYACLAGFFAICLFVFVSTLSDDHPRYFGKGTIIGINPGLGYMPWMKNDTESTLIAFNQNDYGSYRKYVTTMDTFFQDNYDKHIEEFKECTKTDKPEDIEGKPCKFDRNATMFHECTKDDYGFKTGKPCIALRLNRLIDWEPVDYPDGSVPDPVKDRYNQGDIAVDCHGEYFADKDNMGPVDYYPKAGFDGKYFPYRKYTSESGEILYHSPLVFVQFNELPLGMLIMVECRAYAYNIIHDRTNQLGMVHFELLRDTKSLKSD